MGLTYLERQVVRASHHGLIEEVDGLSRSTPRRSCQHGQSPKADASEDLERADLEGHSRPLVLTGITHQWKSSANPGQPITT